MFKSAIAVAVLAASTVLAQPLDRRELGKPIYSGNQCVAVKGNIFIIEPCSGAPSQNFVYNKRASSTQIRVAGQQYCLDQANLSGGSANLQECEDEAQGQWWNFEGGRIRSLRE